MEILSISELNTAQIVEMLVGGSLLIFCAYISFPLTNWLVQKSFNNWYKYAESEWTKAFFHTNLTRKVALIAPSLIIQIAVGLVPHVNKDVTSIIKNIAVYSDSLAMPLFQPWNSGRHTGGGSFCV